MFHPRTQTLLATAAAFALAPASFGSVIFSTSGDNPNTTVVNTTTATVVEGSITLTAGATGGDINVTATGSNLFGISGNGASTLSDTSEILTLTFDTDVYLEQIDLSQLGNGETATVSIPSLNLSFTVADDGTANVILTAQPGSDPLTGITPGSSTGTSGDTIDFALDSFTLTAGDTILLSVLDTFAAPATDSSVALESITVSAVPEPGSLLLTALGGGLMLLRRRD